MKTSNMLFIMMLLCWSVVFSQKGRYNSNIDYHINNEELFREEIKSDFEDRFNNDEIKNNFKKLREYKIEKELLLESIINELFSSYYLISDINYYQGYIDKIKLELDAVKNQSKVFLSSELVDRINWELSYLNDNSYGKLLMYNENGILVSDLKEVNDRFQSRIDEIQKKQAYRQNLLKSKKNVEKDLNTCVSQIDEAIAPEHQNQKFRSTISIYFTILIGVLLVIFFFIVYKKSDHNLSKELLSGNGLQFVTLFVLIIAIILFGILGILEGSELAAILAGISGYILGKGAPLNPNKDNSTN